MSEYPMIYVGRGLYSKGQFIAEAEKHGAARAIPAAQLRWMKWDDLILLAQWSPDTAAQRATMTFQTDFDGTDAGVPNPRGNKGMRFKRFGAARVFGYFRITGLNMTGTPRMKKELVEKLDVAQTIQYKNVVRVDRRCGSYGVESTSFVRDEIAEIIEKAEEIEKAHGLKFRWFACGKFVPFYLGHSSGGDSYEITLDPARFSRGVVRVNIENFVPGFRENNDEHAVNFILDYERKTYQPKEK